MTEKTSSNRITVPQLVLPLPGGLDDTPLFNSNSPEIVLQSGVLLSTFPAAEKACPEAHLDHPVTGRFDVFFHHITDARKKPSKRTLYLGLLIGNSSTEEVHVRLLNAVSYLTKPDAPFVVLEPVMDNADGELFAGPGDRVMLDSLRDCSQEGWDNSITLAAYETKVVCSLPIPVGSVFHPLNGRTGLICFSSDGPVYLAALSAFAQNRGFGQQRKPAIENWLEILNTGALVQPRDRVPTSPGASGELIYGRAAGIACGSTWRGLITNNDQQNAFSVVAGQTVSYPLCTVVGGTLGTNQVQSAPMAVRYPDTAYQAHGNYGVLYDLTLPLQNNGDTTLSVSLGFQSPLKNSYETAVLRFFKQPPDAIVFRGSVKFAWKDKQEKKQNKLIHLVQKQGQMQDSLVEFPLAPKELLEVNFSLRYPADCTPPHVLTITARN